MTELFHLNLREGIALQTHEGPPRILKKYGTSHYKLQALDYFFKGIAEIPFSEQGLEYFRDNIGFVSLFFFFKKIFLTSAPQFIHMDNFNQLILYNSYFSSEIL